MDKLKSSQNLYILAIFSVFMIVFGSLGTIMSSDSSDYILKSIIRSPLYPLFIDFIKSMFGSQNYSPLAIIQLFLGFFACYRMVRTLQDIFKFNNIVFIILFLLHLTPYGFLFGNTLLSEGLAYPLFLLAMQAFFKGLLRKNMKALFFFVLFTSLLILTRRQYLFLYVVGFIAYVYIILFWEKEPRKEPRKELGEEPREGHRLKNYFALTLLLSIIGTNLLERSYHYYYNDKFTPVPFVGFQLITMPLYLSSEEDLHIFKDKTEASIFKEAQIYMKEKRCNASERWSKNQHPEFNHFYMNYNNVCWHSLSPALSNNHINDWNVKDNLLNHMAWQLIKADWKRYVSLYLRNVIHGLGGYYLFFLIFFTFVASLHFHIKNKDTLSLALFFVILISYGNYFLVAFFEPAMTRYTFSTNIIMISLFIVGILNALKLYGEKQVAERG